MSKVNVLLSSFNGQNYLVEQIESILGQNYHDILLYIRDDGSSDLTSEILQNFTARYSNVQIDLSNNIGVVKSFFTLLQNSNSDCSYYAFSDQDDVWMPDKIRRAVDLINKYDSRTPVLYCSRLEYVDENLKHLGFSNIPTKISFENALVENCATGCTIVINKTARNIILEYLPSETIMHDWWMYLIIIAIGKIIYDRKSLIWYRQHSGNVVGGTASTIKLYKRRISNYVKNYNNDNLIRISGQARIFHDLLAEAIHKDDKDFLIEFINSKKSFQNRLDFIVNSKVNRQSILDTILLRLLILVGKY